MFFVVIILSNFINIIFCESPFFQGSRDNMSIIIIAFPGAPKVSNSAIKKDSEVSEMLKKRVQGTMQSNINITFNPCSNQARIFARNVNIYPRTNIEF